VTTSKELGGHDRHGEKMRTAGAIFAIAICAAALFSGCLSHRAPIDDAAITIGVKARLAKEFGPIEARQVRQFDRGADAQTITYISVSSVNGVVTLTGEVGSKRVKAKAGEIARSVARVVRVNNNLSLAPGYSDDAVGGKR
jgi:osmotically-inducible protein OsmY